MVCCGPKMVGLLSRGDMGPQRPCWHDWCPGRGWRSCVGFQGHRPAREQGRLRRGVHQPHNLHP